MAGRHVKRIKTELAACLPLFSKSKRGDMDLENGSWVRIFDFPLPAGYNARTTDILILLPASYPETPPDWFYLDSGLRRENGTVPHYFEVGDTRHTPDSRPSINGWAGGCIHVAGGWKPTGDPINGHSLVTICKLINDAFHRWKA